MDQKISRKGFLAIIVTAVFGLVLSQLPTGKKLLANGNPNGYGNSTYGGKKA